MVNKKEKPEKFVDILEKIFSELDIDGKKKMSKEQILKKYEEIKSRDKEIKIPNKTDDDKPKRTLSGYQLFSNDERKNIKKEFPDKKPQDVTKLIAERWKKLKENNKDKHEEYLDKAEKLKNNKQSK